jgi:THO complex subunit 1
LRRLSRAEDAVFCGRVFIFVFQSFPLGDKSSVNRHGDYNVDNVTTFEEESQADSEQVANEDSIMVDAEGPTDDTVPTSNEKESMGFDELHPKFWGLQKTFAYPPTIFDAKLLADFKEAFSATLAKFNSVPKVISAPAVEGKQSLKRKAEDTEHDEVANNFNPKYLTSRELFELEVSVLTCVEDQANNHRTAERSVLSTSYFGASDDPA